MAAKAKNNQPDSAARDAAAIFISREVSAPVSLVWEVWTDPRHIAQWWGPKGFTNTLLEMDARPGGHWRHIMHGPDGSDYPNHVVFVEAVKPERLVYTHAGESAANACQFLVTVTFEPIGEKTRVTLTMQFETQAERDETAAQGAVTSGHETLERLDSYAASLHASGSNGSNAMPDAHPADGREIVTTRTVSAPRNLVWQVWTNPEHVTHWWGPVGFSTTTQSHDLKPGGIWRFVMHGPDGTDYKNRVEFIEVRAPAFLSYRHAGEGDHEHIKFYNTVTFVPDGDSTCITMRAVFETAELRNFVVEKHGAVEGGKQTLARFAAYVEKKLT